MTGLPTFWHNTGNMQAIHHPDSSFYSTRIMGGNSLACLDLEILNEVAYQSGCRRSVDWSIAKLVDVTLYHMQCQIPEYIQSTSPYKLSREV